MIYLYTNFHGSGSRESLIVVIRRKVMFCRVPHKSNLYALHLLTQGNISEPYSERPWQ